MQRNVESEIRTPAKHSLKKILSLEQREKLLQELTPEKSRELWKEFGLENISKL